MVDVLTNMAGAAAAGRGSQPSGPRWRPAPRPSSSATRCCRPSPMTCARRWPRSWPRPPACGKFGDRFVAAEVREDLTLTIQEEAERLNLFVGNL